jgi:hypothetical protein
VVMDLDAMDFGALAYAAIAVMQFEGFG